MSCFVLLVHYNSFRVLFSPLVWFGTRVVCSLGPYGEMRVAENNCHNITKDDKRKEER